MDFATWDPNIDALPVRVSEAELISLLGEPFATTQGTSPLADAELGEGGTYGHFAGFRYLKYIIWCATPEPQSDTCIFLEFIVFRDYVVHAHQVAF